MEDTTPRNVICDEYPQLWTTPADRWFAGIERVFDIHEITDDKIKYSYLLKSLDEDSLKIVQDHVLHPPVKNSYESIKALLIHRLPEARKFQKCKSIRDLQLDTQKPSELLRKMLNLAENIVDHDFVRSAFVKCLPLKVQVILENCRMLPLPHLGSLADHIIEYVLENNANGLFGERLNTLEKKVTVLSSTLEKYSTALEKFTKQPRKKNKSGRERGPAGSAASILNASLEPGACYYHHKFGIFAKRCVRPCSSVFSPFSA